MHHAGESDSFEQVDPPDWYKFNGITAPHGAFEYGV
jgi:hypothetical protein